MDPTLAPTDTTLVGVWAHPDDETYLSALLMQRWIRAGGRAVVITATAGERGLSGPTPAGGDERNEELRLALSVLGVEEAIALGIPDGVCAQQDHRRCARRVGGLLDELQPDAVVTFGPDGITGHPDHVAVSAWTLVACRNRPCRIHLAAMSTSFADRHRELHEQIGLMMDDGAVATADDDQVDLLIEATPAERRAKLDAFAAHGSQNAVACGHGRRPVRVLVVRRDVPGPEADDFAWATTLVGGG